MIIEKVFRAKKKYQEGTDNPKINYYMCESDDDNNKISVIDQESYNITNDEFFI